MAKDPTPARTEAEKQPAAASARAEIDAFLSKVRKSLGPATQSGQRGRLIFALDATMSRQPLWDTACKLQGDMFREAASIGGLDVQLVYYRGLTECRASKWVSDATRLGSLMETIDCRGGHSQIGKVLAHARRESETQQVQALVFVGDAMEEKIDDLCAAAGALGLLGVPTFMFQEGGDAVAEQAFREIARLSRGAYCRFDPGAAHQLAELLRAVAAYAAGGMKALADLKGRNNAGAVKLLGAVEIAHADAFVRHSSVLVICCFGVLNGVCQGRSQIPRQGDAAGRRHSGAGLRRRFLFVRGEPQGRHPARRLTGLGLLGWGPFASTGSVSSALRRRRAKCRGCARRSSRWSSTTTPARCAARSSPGATRALRWTRWKCPCCSAC